ncbi:uncharacterized protein [Dermacentor andersoni]|uniref:uncharacterized protein isoform X4 n=1 Tax=Dermacentor andersoni TaxID=34620 RepID=UPI003B3ABA5C
MGRPRVIRTLEEQAAFDKRRREQNRERARLRRADAAARAQEQARAAERKQQLRAEDPAAFQAVLQRKAECKRQWRADAANREAELNRDVERKRLRRAREHEQRRRREYDGNSTFARANDARLRREFLEQHVGSSYDRLWFDSNLTSIDGSRAHQQLDDAMSVLTRWFPAAPDVVGEALPAADGVKARRARVHRTERRWPLVTCPHHSTSAAGTLRVATADFSAVFPDIDFKQAVEAACDKAPFIEASLASTTCRVEPWRGLQDKCVGECEALLQHAEQSCQTEHHITLVRCTKPQVSTCSVEVQADPWWQHHCGIQPIGVDLCET